MSKAMPPHCIGEETKVEGSRAMSVGSLGLGTQLWKSSPSHAAPGSVPP